jgi:hypothetical protein
MTKRRAAFRMPAYLNGCEDGDRVSEGGGEASEGEEIRTLEITLDEAMRLMDSGAIQDGKTIILLQYAARTGLKGLRRTGASQDSGIRVRRLPISAGTKLPTSTGQHRRSAWH